MKNNLLTLAVIVLISFIASTTAFAQYIPVLEPSAGEIKDPSLKVELTKKYFMAWENIRLLYQGEAKPLTVKVTNQKQEEVQFQGILRQEGDKKFLDIEIPKNIKPGTYHVLIKDGEKILTDENVFWGKTVMNEKTSVLKQGQIGNTDVVLFGEDGEIICDTEKQILLKNLVTNEEKNQSLTNPSECSKESPASYASVFQTDNVGLYAMVVKDDSAHEDVSATFDVVNTAPLDIKKEYNTFVNKDADYSNKITITANEDFSGKITEIVPATLNPTDINETNVGNPNEISEDNSTMNLMLPFKGDYPITLGFGEEPDPETHLLEAYHSYGVKAHDGVDFAVAPGTDILSVDDGKAVEIPPFAVAYGMTVVVQHSWGRSYYGHLSAMKIKVGDQVKKGEVIGLSGNTGLSTGPHLHFSIEPNNPELENGYLGKINPLQNLSIANKFKLSQKKIVWNVDLKKGQQTTLGYRIKPDDGDTYLISGSKLSAKNSQDSVIYEDKNPWTYILAGKE